MNINKVDLSGNTIYLAKNYFNAKRIIYYPFKPKKIDTSAPGRPRLFGTVPNIDGSIKETYVRLSETGQVDIKVMGNWLKNRLLQLKIQREALEREANFLEEFVNNR